MANKFKTILVLFVVIIGCKSNHISVLGDGWTMIPNDSLFFKKNYRSSYEATIPDLIDPNCIYVENYYLSGTKRVKFKRDDDVHRNIFRFYASGAVNDFSMPNPYTLNDPKLFDPKYRGKRGICFEKDGVTYIDIIGKSSELRTIGTYRYQVVSVTSDSLKIKFAKDKDNTLYVFSKQCDITETIKDYNAEW